MRDNANSHLFKGTRIGQLKTMLREKVLLNTLLYFWHFNHYYLIIYK